MMRRLRIKIYGQVQGVSFRYHATQTARALGLAGWVRNAPDGTVAALAEGEEQALKKLLDWCRVGPPGARVVRVEERWEEKDNSDTLDN